MYTVATFAVTLQCRYQYIMHTQYTVHRLVISYCRENKPNFMLSEPHSLAAVNAKDYFLSNMA